MSDKSGKKICAVCKTKPATIFFTNISADGKVQALDLCEDCAKAKGVSDLASFAMADLMHGLGASLVENASPAAAETRCPRCGFTQADFKKSGRLGCPQCYQAFAEGLAGLLKTMHKDTRHTGKVPEALRQTRDRQDRLKLLQRKLNKAIETEDFEQAAQLRDEIKAFTSAAAPPVKAG